MIGRLLADRLGRWLMFRFDPETAHRLAIQGLKTGRLRPPPLEADSRLAVTVAGMTMANPVGVAAGFDKNAEVPDALAGLGFGFVEVGTVTPRPQPGNPKPRVFRLPEDHGVINRLGFNNDGHAAAQKRLGRRRGGGVIGVNVGANKDSEDRISDYVSGLTEFYDLADYITVNISSPNTPGLRDLQARESLAELLARLGERRMRLTEDSGVWRPIFVKIAPDIDEAALDDIVTEIQDKRMDGLIVSNTTLSRAGLHSDPGEAGGLSGRPLFERSTIVLAKARQRAGPELAVVGVGGVESAETALAKIEAGADLVQLYTAMIYRGPMIARTILAGLSAALDRRGATSIADLRDGNVDAWASRPIPSP